MNGAIHQCADDGAEDHARPIEVHLKNPAREIDQHVHAEKYAKALLTADQGSWLMAANSIAASNA
jgi:hypothetical protein